MDFGELMQKVAQKNNTTADEVVTEIERAIADGVKSEEPQVKEKWKKIPHENEVPSPEELIGYLVSRILCKEEVCKDENYNVHNYVEE